MSNFDSVLRLDTGKSPQTGSFKIPIKCFARKKLRAVKKEKATGLACTRGVEDRDYDPIYK